jgi:vitamin B12 transporter
MKGVLLHIVCLVFPFITKGATAYVDSVAYDSFYLEPAQIHAKKNNKASFVMYPIGNSEGGQEYSEIFNSNLNFNSLADEMIQKGVLNIRNNGSGILSLMSLRGLYGSQLNLMWEGISIQSPMNGQLDLSLIPGFFIDYAKIFTTNSGASNANSALSGSLEIGSEIPVFKQNKVEFFLSRGSFNAGFYGTNIQLSRKNLISRTKIFHNHATNDYPIRKVSLSDRAYQKNNAVQSQGVLQEFFLRTKKNNLLEAKLWIQSAQRQIPESIWSLNPSSLQEDKSIRALLAYKSGKKILKSNKIAYLMEDILFRDNFRAYPNIVQTLSHISSLSYSLKKHSVIEIGVNQSLAVASSNGYVDKKNQILNALYLSADSKVKKLYSNFSVRQQWLQEARLPFLFSMNIAYSITDKFLVNASLGSYYRVPTLNDLYWLPGGNVNLRGENSFKKELGFLWNKLNKQKTSLKVSVFTNKVQDLIVWLPSSLGYFEANNVRGLDIKGVEYLLTSQIYKKQNSSIFAQISGSYILSSYSDVEAGQENMLGNQAIFIPKTVWSAQLKFQYKKLFSECIFNYSSLRYYSTDNAYFLPSYYLLNFRVFSEFKLAKNQFLIGLNSQNITQTYYELMPDRPMPGLQFSVFLKHTLFNKL